MNFFDDERKIIDFFQDSSIFETWFPTPSLGAVRIYKSIHNRKSGTSGYTMQESLIHHPTFIPKSLAL